MIYKWWRVIVIFLTEFKVLWSSITPSSVTNCPCLSLHSPGIWLCLRMRNRERHVAKITFWFYSFPYIWVCLKMRYTMASSCFNQWASICLRNPQKYQTPSLKIPNSGCPHWENQKSTTQQIPLPMKNLTKFHHINWIPIQYIDPITVNLFKSQKIDSNYQHPHDLQPKNWSEICEIWPAFRRPL